MLEPPERLAYVDRCSASMSFAAAGRGSCSGVPRDPTPVMVAFDCAVVVCILTNP
jgi:hypothetical protein